MHCTAHLDFSLCSLAIVQSEQVTSLQIDCCCTARVLLEVCLQDLGADIKIVQLAVAQRYVDIESIVVTMLQQELLVDVSCLLYNRAAGPSRLSE